MVQTPVSLRTSLARARKPGQIAQTVPIEIWLYIAQFIDDQDLSRMRYLNSIFFSLNFTRKYGKVRIDHGRSSLALKSLLERLRTPYAGNRVHTLSIRTDAQISLIYSGEFPEYPTSPLQPPTVDSQIAAAETPQAQELAKDIDKAVKTFTNLRSLTISFGPTCGLYMKTLWRRASPTLTHLELLMSAYDARHILDIPETTFFPRLESFSIHFLPYRPELVRKDELLDTAGYVRVFERLQAALPLKLTALSLHRFWATARVLLRPENFPSLRKLHCSEGENIRGWHPWETPGLPTLSQFITSHSETLEHVIYEERPNQYEIKASSFTVEIPVKALKYLELDMSLFVKHRDLILAQLRRCWMLRRLRLNGSEGLSAPETDELVRALSQAAGTLRELELPIHTLRTRTLAMIATTCTSLSVLRVWCITRHDQPLLQGLGEGTLSSSSSDVWKRVEFEGLAENRRKLESRVGSGKGEDVLMEALRQSAVIKV